MEDAMKNIQESQFVTNVKSYFKNMGSSGPSGYDVQAVKVIWHSLRRRLVR